MELKNMPLYRFVRNYEKELHVVKFKKGSYIERADKRDAECLYYILDGIVCEEIVTRSGKKILVDEISAGMFAGHISTIRGSSLHCDAVAKTNCILVKINLSVLYKLLQNDEFSKYFYCITSERLYYMYKKLLLEKLFTWEQIVAYHLLMNSNGDIFEYKSIYSICEKLNISRKGLYNVVNNLVSKKCLEKKDSNSFVIKDREYIDNLAKDVCDYYAKF